jgi:hypothetical protein
VIFDEIRLTFFSSKITFDPAAGAFAAAAAF